MLGWAFYVARDAFIFTLPVHFERSLPHSLLHVVLITDVLKTSVTASSVAAANKN